MNGRCPKCHSAEETLGHVLNACTPNAGLMRDRHNSVLKRLVKAIPPEVGDKFVEQRVQECTEDLRPDIVIKNSSTSTAYIVDVTIFLLKGKRLLLKWQGRKSYASMLLSRLSWREKVLKQCRFMLLWWVHLVLGMRQMSRC